MKKISVVLFAVFLLLMPVQARAAGSASMSGPGTVRAGDTIQVTFYAGGGIYGGSGTVNYDSSQLTLKGYAAAIGGSWAVEFAGNNFVFYDNSMENPISSAAIFTATFQVSSSVQPGTSITVSAGGVTLSDGTADSSVGTVSYGVTVAPPLSGNANLKSLSVSNATITPAFSPDVTEYTASVPFTTGSLSLSAEAEHGGAAVSVGNTGLAAGGTVDVTVTVKAENGNTKVYHIRTFRAQDPNYVPSDVNTLSALALEEFRISPVFDAACLHYAVYLPYEVENLQLQVQKTDAKSSVTLPELKNIPVGETTYEITVTAENADVRVYTLTVFRAPVFDPTAEPEEVPVEESVVETTEPTEPTEQEPTETPTQPTEQVTQTPTQPVDESVPQEKNSSWWLWTLVAVGCFLAGGLTAFAGLRLCKRKQ